ncbi:Hypothetical predicted protein [Olea europaea subsp. europaea]|uniref:Uncharacterized protein n=1 Tax=Olea europaea subsp. europaea TaxID=158383 RepID=A0A8S0THK5_OLEEU|nr:Hypothetical predicted protein [Olea europaea subsp. europaea]
MSISLNLAQIARSLDTKLLHEIWKIRLKNRLIRAGTSVQAVMTKQNSLDHAAAGSKEAFSKLAATGSKENSSKLDAVASNEATAGNKEHVQLVQAAAKDQLPDSAHGKYMVQQHRPDLQTGIVEIEALKLDDELNKKLKEKMAE